MSPCKQRSRVHLRIYYSRFPMLTYFNNIFILIIILHLNYSLPYSFFKSSTHLNYVNNKLCIYYRKYKFEEVVYNSLNKNQLFSHTFFHSMLLDNYDPSSIKLFSKCARNQASRFAQNKKSGIDQRPHSSLIVYNESMKKRKTISTFDMSESREQRQKKYRPVNTPAVGQYNPRTEKKIKFTWDILKIYNNRSRSRKAQQNTHQSQILHETNKAQNTHNQMIQNTVMTEISEPVSADIQKKQIAIEEQPTIRANSTKKKDKYISNRLRSQNNRYKTIKSQVDMSRMTGRKNTNDLLTLEDQDLQQQSQNIDINRSIEFLKSKTSQNLLFQRQLSREKVNSLSKPIIVPSDYSYDYNIIKPKEAKAIPFGKSVGRNVVNKSQNQSAYCYTHYDYDGYVWGAKSNIYSNTKTHIIQFKKQTNRTLFKR